jgi:hypothetical protein
MQAGADEIVAVRQEILYLLRRQMEALDSPLGLTDARLIECYERQGRVQELREKLDAMLRSATEAESLPDDAPETPPRAAQVMTARMDNAANV